MAATTSSCTEHQVQDPRQHQQTLQTNNLKTTIAYKMLTAHVMDIK
jgi:hypothetical protein